VDKTGEGTVDDMAWPRTGFYRCWSDTFSMPSAAADYKL